MNDEKDKDLIEAVAMPWMCIEEKPCEETMPVHWDELITALTGALTTARQEEQRSFINNLAAVLDGDDVEVFTALVMKAKAHLDLNRGTRSALQSEAEIRRDERKTVWEKALNLTRVTATATNMPEIWALHERFRELEIASSEGRSE
jgi:hypothetical protein